MDRLVTHVLRPHHPDLDLDLDLDLDPDPDPDR
jgi:hypothetical protein